MFFFKGTVSQDILLHVFSMNHLPPSLWKSVNLWTQKICDICGPSACVAICGTAGIPSEITICSVYSVFRGIIFLSEIPNPSTKLYKVKTADSCCHSLSTGNYIPLLSLLKVSPAPPPPHTHKWRKYILRVEGGISRAIPRKCSPLAQIRRGQKKPGPLLLVYFMAYISKDAG